MPHPAILAELFSTDVPEDWPVLFAAEHALALPYIALRVYKLFSVVDQLLMFVLGVDELQTQGLLPPTGTVVQQ